MGKKQIKVNYLARVEGEAKIEAVISNGEVKSLTLNIWEPPRFFEGFLVGRLFYEIPDIVARICGICPVSHMTTAVRAVENALGIEVSEQTRLLRRLMATSQIVASHLVHLYMLVLPDYLGYDSIISMLSKHRQIVERVLKMKTIVNKITATVGGQPLHPRTLIVGGFTKVPERETLVKLAQELKRIKEDALETVYFFSKLPLPEFNRRAIHIALRNNSEYPINEGKLVSTEGLNIEETEYREHFREIQVPWANAKYSVVTDTIPFAVGALARLNLNFDLLSPDAKNIAKEVGYQIPNFNPFSISRAQAIEIVNGIDICLELLNRLRPKKEKISYKVRAGEGSAITEAPRGSLYHSYRINRDGKVERADIVTPTAHNAFNIEKDLRVLLPKVSYMEEEKLTLVCEKLIRSYDPCFSCSVHIVKK